MVKPLYQFEHSGVITASELALPEWDCFGASHDGKPDVTIRCRQGGHSSDPRHTIGDEGYAGAADKLAFYVDGVGTWLVEGGCTITLFSDPQADPRALRLFTLGSAWGALGYQRDWLMWHGSAVEWLDGAVMLCGNQGFGKSTLAAYLISQSHALLADDLSRIVPAQDHKPAAIYPSSARLKLWDDAVEGLNMSEAVIERDLLRADKYHCAARRAVSPLPRPLRAVVCLAWGEQHKLQKLVGGEAVREVLAATAYRPAFLQAMGLESRYTQKTLQIIADVPVYRLTRPKDLSELATSYALLKREFGK